MFKSLSNELKIKEPTQEITRDSFKDLDKDKSGLISIDEFKPFIVNLLNMLY